MSYVFVYTFFLFTKHFHKHFSSPYNYELNYFKLNFFAHITANKINITCQRSQTSKWHTKMTTFFAGASTSILFLYTTANSFQVLKMYIDTYSYL